MQNAGCNPYSPEEVEGRFQELRAQRVRAKQLFYCYAADAESGEVGEMDDDLYSRYYDELNEQ